MATEEEVVKDELTKRREEEYEMQLFGLTSRTVFAVLKQNIEETVDLKCQQMYSSIEKKYNFDENKKAMLKDNIKQLRKAYYKNMQPDLNALEKVVNKYISIPKNVLLEEDKAQAKQYSDEEFQNLEKKLKDMQEQVKRATIYNAALKEELETLENLEKSQELATKLCDVIDKGLDVKKISSKTQQAIENYKKLSNSLDTIKPETDKDIYNPKLDKNDLESFTTDNES